MTRNQNVLLPVLEWSPIGVRLFDTSAQIASGPDIASVSGRIGGHRVIVALSRRSAFVRTLRVPNASAEEVGKAIGLQIGQLFPVAGSQLAFGFRLTLDVDRDGRLAIVGACTVDTMRKLHAQLEAAGLSAEIVLPAALAAPILATSIGASDGAVVEETSEGIAIDIVSGGELKTSRVVPKPLESSELDAEIARTFGVAGIAKGAVITVGSVSVSSAGNRAPSSSLIALAASGAAKLGIHLELPELVEKRKVERAQSRSRVALLACAMALIALVSTFMHRLQLADRVRHEEQTWQRSLKELSDNKSASSSKANQTNQTAGVLASAFEPAQTTSDVIQLVANVVPKDVWMNGITFERGKPLFVRGSAVRNEAVTEYLDALTTITDPVSGKARFRDVKLVFANNGKVENTPVVNFAIQLFPVGNVPIVEGKKVKK